MVDGIGTKPFADITPADAWAKVLENMNPPEGSEITDAPPAEVQKETPTKEETAKKEAGEESFEKPDAAALTVEKLDELIATIQNQGRVKEQGEAEPKTEAEADKFLEELRENNPAMAKMYEDILEIKNELAARKQSEYDEAVQAEITNLDKQMEETATEFSMTPKQAAAVIAYMDEYPDVARVLSFREATLRVFPEIGKSGTKEAAATETVPARTQATAKIVSETSNGSGPPKEFKPGPGSDFSDVSSFVLRKHFGVRG